MSMSVATNEMNEMEPTGWWIRPCGGRDVMQLAVPLIISMSALTIMQFVDRMFLYWHSEEEMAAAMPAGMVYFMLVCFPMGMAQYISTFVAQYRGAGHKERIGIAFSQGARVGFYCTPLFLATIPLAPTIFRLAGHEPQLAAFEALYFQISMFGGGGFVLACSMSAFFTGLGKTRVVMVVDCSSAVLNVILDYGWIFGHFGLPALGIEGAAWATVTSLWFRAATYAVLMTASKYRVTYCLWSGRRFNAPLMGRLLRFGGPNGLQLLIEIGGFTLFLLLVGTLGKDAMAATTLAFNINLLAFLPMLGLGIALSTIVGQQLGRNRPTLAARATWTSLWIAMGYMGMIALMYVTAPDLILMGHAAGSSPEDFAKLRDTTVVLLRFVAAYCLFDAMNVIFASALKGAGDTRFIMLVSLVVTPFPLLAAWAGMRFADGGLIWCWVIATLWVSSVGLLYGARFLNGQWRDMRVIESDLLTT